MSEQEILEQAGYVLNNGKKYIEYYDGTVKYQPFP